MRRRILLIGGLILVGFALMVKPAIVKTEESARLLVLFRWQSGAIRFVNSVTQRPVAIYFRVGSVFQNFSVATDEATEAYYTGGLYPMNRALLKESTRVLRFCSVKGISVNIGLYDLFANDGCLEIKLLWTL